MATTNSLSSVYNDALQNYEELYRRGKLKSTELALIKGRASIGDVLKEVDQAKTKLIHRITPVYVERLERFSKIIEVAIQSNPDIAALVWSGVKFVIMICQDVFDAYDRICEILEKISLCLERFSDIVDMVGVTELLGSRLATFYGDIMEFCLETTKFYARSKWRTVVVSISKSLSEPFDKLLCQVHSHTEEIDKAAAVEHMRMTRNALQPQVHNIPHSPPSKIFLVPDLLHRHFTGRAKQLQQVSQILENSPPSSKRVSIYGMPGVGKTQLALKYAHENINLYTNVFYIQATGREQLIQGYQNTCGLLQLPESSSQEQELKVEGVKRWLSNNPDWLIVFDNVVNGPMVREFLPASATGSIFFTMRDRSIAEELGLGGTLELLPMEEADGVELILNVTGESGSLTDPTARNLAIELNRELGGLPLALEQGASFANDRNWPLEQYLSRLRAQKTETLKLETGKGGISHSNFYSSFRLAIQRVTPKAVILLKVLSHLDHQDVPLKLFEYANKSSELVDFLDGLEKYSVLPKDATVSRIKRFSSRIKVRLASSHPGKVVYDSINLYNIPGGSNVVKLLRELVSDMDEIEKAVSNLQASSLIRREETGNIWMHDLVRDMSEDLIDTREKKLFAASAIVLTKNAFPSNTRDHKTWSICGIFASHIVAASRYGEIQEIPFVEVTDAATGLAEYYYEKSRYNEALHVYQWVLDSQEKSLGKDHPDTLTTVNNMALVLSGKGEYSKALEWYERALSGKKALRKDHPDTFTTMHNMALVFCRQGEYSKAFEWYERVLSGEEKELGKDHPDILTTVHNIASVFGNQGEYSKALEWYGRALSQKEKVLGKDDPHTLFTVDGMAAVFRDQGEYSKALEWYERVLSEREKVLGKDHPHTLFTVNGMAAVFRDQGEYSKALEWYERALSGEEKVLGKDHPHTLSTVNGMAAVFRDQGEYSKALEWYGRALDGREKALGKDHPYTQRTANSLKELQEKERLKATKVENDCASVVIPSLQAFER